MTYNATIFLFFTLVLGISAGASGAAIYGVITKHPKPSVALLIILASLAVAALIQGVALWLGIGIYGVLR